MSESERSSLRASGDVIRKIQEKRMQSVFKLVVEKIKNVDKCKGKHVVFLVGMSQVGKSTLVNSLCFGALKKKFLGRGKFEFSVPEGSIGQAPVGQGLCVCTQYPTPYELDDGTVVVDTRGFFDDRMQTEDEIVSSVVMEYILREAESVSLACLARCSDLFNHPVGMSYVGERLGKIIKSDAEPVLFLFNAYPAEPGEMDEKSPEERQKYIEDILVEEVKKTVEEELKQSLRKKEIAELKEESEENDDRDNQNGEENKRYLQVMSNAILEGEAKKGGIAYIDPSDDYSVGLLKKALKELKPVSKEYLSFDRCSEEASEFRKYLDEIRELHLSVLSGEELYEQYPADLITKVLDDKKKECEKHEKVLNELKDANEDRVRYYKDEYGCGMFENKAKELKEEQHKCENEIIFCEGYIRGVENAPPVLFHSDCWNYVGVHAKKHIVRYPYGDEIPFEHYEEILSPETVPINIVSTNPKDFEIHYGFKPKAGRIAKGVIGGVVAAGGLVMTAASLGVLAPVGVPLAAAGGVGVGSALVNEFTGRVNFYVKYANLPENAEALKQCRENIEHFKRKVTDLDERIKNILESSSSELNKRVQTMLEANKKELQVLEQFLTFENAVHDLYEKRKEDMKQFYDVVKQFYPNQKSFNDFVSLYEKVTSGKVEVENGEKHIPISYLDRPEMAAKFANFFPDLWIGH